jgi:hypothetical protein
MLAGISPKIEALSTTLLMNFCIYLTRRAAGVREMCASLSEPNVQHAGVL